jgi:ABC-type sugar transport system ATPase subunit
LSLVLDSVRKSYGTVEVLHGVSLTAEYGQVAAIVGANGAGKSTLIKVLSGAHPKDSGDIRLDGRSLTLRGPRDAIAEGVRTVYQELSLVPELSVTENLLMGALPRRGGLIDWKAAHRRAGDILAEIGFDAIDPHSRTKDLSVAKQQMVEIAKALVTKPRILILDEPSAILAGSDLESLFRLVRRLAAGGTLVVYISHRLAEVLDLADRIVVMKDGSFIAETTPGETTEAEIVALMAGRRIEQVYTARRESCGEPALAVEGLSRAGEFEDISFTLQKDLVRNK